MLIDSNIAIYAAQSPDTDLHRFIYSDTPSASVISYIEALGFHQLGEFERSFLERFFQVAEILPLSNEIAQLAISLRQQHRMGLGDSIIAATALVHGLTLATHNTEDFRWIAELELLDPLTNYQ